MFYDQIFYNQIRFALITKDHPNKKPEISFQLINKNNRRIKKVNIPLVRCSISVVDSLFLLLYEVYLILMIES